MNAFYTSLNNDAHKKMEIDERLRIISVLVVWHFGNSKIEFQSESPANWRWPK